MKRNNLPFIPVIVGTEINSYNLAISFREQYGIHPVLVGRGELSFTKWSNIPRVVEIFPNLGEREAFADILIQVAEQYKEDGKQLLLVGTNDLYVRLIIEHQEQLRRYYTFNYIEEPLMNDLLVKKNFYALCEKHGVDIPATHFHSCQTDAPFEGDVTFPVIVKPSNGVLYYKNPFPNMQKVYKVDSYDEINEVVTTIRESGYDADLIIQDYIPGDDTYMWDSVVYVSSKGKPQLVTFAQVVLQEHELTAIGNYTALITRYNEKMMKVLQQFLEEVGYVGFANFDLKYDPRDGTFKVFEVNIRQGRSSYYITSCGHNMAKYLVDDLIYNVDKPLTYLDEEHLFTVVPKYVLKNFVKDDEVRADVRRLLKEGKYRNPLFYKRDRHIKRKFFMMARQVNYVRKYRNSEWVE